MPRLHCILLFLLPISVLMSNCPDNNFTDYLIEKFSAQINSLRFDLGIDEEEPKYLCRLGWEAWYYAYYYYDLRLRFPENMFFYEYKYLRWYAIEREQIFSFSSRSDTYLAEKAFNFWMLRQNNPFVAAVELAKTFGCGVADIPEIYVSPANTRIACIFSTERYTFPP